MCIFHKWSQWVQYTLEIPERQVTKNYYLVAVSEYRQKRTCRKCGKVQDEYIRTLSTVDTTLGENMLTDERYKQLMVDVGMPNSRSLLQALQQSAKEAIALYVRNNPTTDENNTVTTNNYKIETYDQGQNFWCFKVYHEGGTLVAHSTDGYETREAAVYDAINFTRWCVV